MESQYLANVSEEVGKSKMPLSRTKYGQESLEAHKSPGKGYTGIMADVLKYVAGRPEILQNCYAKPQ